MASSFLAERTQSRLSKDLRCFKEWSRTAIVRSDQERKDQGSAEAMQREAGRCKCGHLLLLRSGMRGGLQSCMCFFILSLIPGGEGVENDCPLARPWELSHLLRPLFRPSPPHSPESVSYSLDPAQSVGFQGMAWGSGQLPADLQDPEPRGPRAQEQAANPFPLLSCRNTMSSTPPWPGARPTPRGLTACGPAWCTWSRCAPAPWPATESSVARCASRPWRMVRGRQVTWIRAGSRGRRSPQEAVVTAEMPAANWIPVELPRKGLPLGGPAFTRQSICLKPGRVFDIWWVFLRRSLYRARAEAPTCTPASAEQGAQHKIKGHALLGFWVVSPSLPLHSSALGAGSWVHSLTAWVKGSGKKTEGHTEAVPHASEYLKQLHMWPPVGPAEVSPERRATVFQAVSKARQSCPWKYFHLWALLVPCCHNLCYSSEITSFSCYENSVSL